MTEFFRRRAFNDLESWKSDPHRKPLVIRGARQVGKSSLVRMFAAKYRRYAELNLERSSHADLFRKGLPFEDLVRAIQLECRVPPGEDPWLLFLDEIQAVPQAISLLRFFAEERPDIHVIAAGSLLEAAIESAQTPFPVGRVQFLYLRPLDFEEFLQACGETEALSAWKETPAPSYAHARLLRLFHEYALVGGMPEAVRRYVDRRGDLVEVNRVYADLLTAYREDIPKYARNETLRRVILHCLETAPLFSGSRITFHGFGGSAYRSREVGEALRALEKAMLLELVYPTTQTQPPLMADRRKSPRLQFLDVGLVNHVAGLQRQVLETEDLNDLYRGRLIEQVVGQELKARDLRTDTRLIFWVRDKPQAQAEVDYLVVVNDKVVPVEAKSGAAGKLRSLHQFVARSACELAVRLYAGEFSLQEVSAEGIRYRLINVPYYAASRLAEYIRCAEVGHGT